MTSSSGRTVSRGVVTIVVLSFAAIQLTQLVLLCLFEKVEYDTFTFYFSKVELMRWATADRIPLTTTEQEFLPIGFTKLQMLFTGSRLWPSNSLNFIVALLGGLILARFIPRLFVVFAALTLASNAFFMQYTSYKTDAPLAVLAALLILAASVPPFRFQLTALCALSLLMMSIKWLAAPIVGIAGVLYLSTFVRRAANDVRDLAEDGAVALAISALLFGYLELGVYANTFRETGKLFPTQSFGVGAVGFSGSHVLLGIPQYLLTSFVETFEPIWRRTMHYPALGSFLETVTLGAKQHVITSVGAIGNNLNLFVGAGLIASAWVLVRHSRNVEPFVRNCAIAALFITVLFLALYPYQPLYANRYFLPAQVLSYVPLAYVIMRVLERRNLVAPALVAIAVAHIFDGAFMLIRDHNRNLITINDISAVTTRQIKEGAVPAPVWIPPIYTLSKVAQTFRGWSGFQKVYDSLNSTIRPWDPLTIFLNSKPPQRGADYTYPFLRDRHPANTAIVDLEKGTDALSAPHVLCFTISACAAVEASGKYVKIADQGPTISFWRLR